MVLKKIRLIKGEINDKAELIVALKYADIDQIKEVISIHPKIAFNTLQQFKEVSENVDLSKVQTHFIGNIQSNKIRKILELKPFLIQSVSSFDLAEKINSEAEKMKLIQYVLLQISSDKNKNYGIWQEIFDEEFKKISFLKNLKILGIMTIPPEKEIIGEENLKSIFQKMKFLKDKYNFEILSMGMSEDYLMAIENGSNMIRVGRKIFQ